MLQIQIIDVAVYTNWLG